MSQLKRAEEIAQHLAAVKATQEVSLEEVRQRLSEMVVNDAFDPDLLWNLPAVALAVLDAWETRAPGVLREAMFPMVPAPPLFAKAQKVRRVVNPVPEKPRKVVRQ